MEQPESTPASEPSDLTVPDALPGFWRRHALVSGIVAINLLVWVVQLFRGSSWSEPSIQSLFDGGGSLSVYSLTDEPWRLFTSLFVHAGLMHLAMNVLLLLQVAPLVTARFGTGGLFWIYVLGGLMATTTSAAWGAVSLVGALSVDGTAFIRSVQLVVSVGASGAIMAVCGGLLASQIRGDRSQDPKAREELQKALMVIIGVILMMGLFIPGIDQVQHGAGVLAGVVLGLVLPLSPAADGRASAALRLAGALAGAAAVWWTVFTWVPQPLLLQARELLDAERKEARTGRAAEQAEATQAQRAQTERDRLPEPVDAEEAMGTTHQVSRFASGMAASADGRLLYIADPVDNLLAVFDTASRTVVQKVVAPKVTVRQRNGCFLEFDELCDWKGASSVALVPGKGLAVVPGMFRNAVAVIDLATGQVVHRLALGSEPVGLLVAPDESRGYLTTLRYDLVEVDLLTGKISRRVKLPDLDEARHPAYAHDTLWMGAGADTLFVSLRGAPYAGVFRVELPTLSARFDGQEAVGFPASDPHHGGDTYLWSSQGALFRLDQAGAVAQRWWFCSSGSGTDRTLASVHHDGEGTRWVAVAEFQQQLNGSGLPFRSVVRIANLETGVTKGVYPVRHATAVGFHFDDATGGLWVLTNGGELVHLRTDKRLRRTPDIAPDLLC